MIAWLKGLDVQGAFVMESHLVRPLSPASRYQITVADPQGWEELAIRIEGRKRPLIAHSTSIFAVTNIPLLQVLMAA